MIPTVGIVPETEEIVDNLKRVYLIMEHVQLVFVAVTILVTLLVSSVGYNTLLTTFEVLT